MLESLARIFLIGLLLGSLFARLRLPSLLGMLLTGVLLGPFVLNQIDSSILSISADLRQFALVVILCRAGLSLNLDDLKKVGRPVVLMCFVPACFEIAGMVLLAPTLLNISILDAAIMGSVVAAVSPAVVVPRMLKLMNEGYGTDEGIPALIMAGASVDDVFVIVLFTSFIFFSSGGNITLMHFAQIPLSIVLGIIGGGAIGLGFVQLTKRVPMRDSIKVVILLSISFLLVALETSLESIVPFSGLLAVMAAGVVVLRISPTLANRLSAKFSKLWVAAEILLFVLVGATVDVRYVVSGGVNMIALLLFALLLRMLGVYLCLIRTQLTMKERLFCMVAYIPKATVQAAIGGIALSMGLPCGNVVLAVAVLSIFLTAPLGALGIDLLYKKTLRSSIEP